VLSEQHRGKRDELKWALKKTYCRSLDSCSTASAEDCSQLIYVRVTGGIRISFLKTSREVTLKRIARRILFKIN